MIDVAFLSVIRRWHLRDGLSIRNIARRTGLSRNTIRKYLRSGVVEPQYPERLSPSQLDAFAPKLALWLQAEGSKNRKQRRNLRQMHADLVALGYAGSYDRVAAFARQWRQSQQQAARTAGRGTFIPLTFAPGDAFQFDWSEDWAVLGGVRTKLQVAQLKLAYSRAFILRAYPLQTHEMLFDAHLHAFRLLGGIPRRGIYDNMKTAVDRVGKGKVRDINQRFQAMASHYLFEPEFCNPAAGWEKGQIEKTVQDSRRRIWQQAPAFQGLADLNAWLDQRIQTLVADMNDLPFPDDRFDLIWSEGAVYIMGFDNELAKWRPLAKPGGYLVVSELSWFRPDPFAEIRDFWGHHYPAMRTVDEHLAAARSAGWRPVGNYHLPAEAWTGYYEPLKQRLPAFRRSYGYDRDAQASADMTEQEMSLMGRYSDVCGYEVFVLRRGA